MENLGAEPHSYTQLETALATGYAHVSLIHQTQVHVVGNLVLK